MFSLVRTESQDINLITWRTIFSCMNWCFNSIHQAKSFSLPPFIQNTGNVFRLLQWLPQCFGTECYRETSQFPTSCESVLFFRACGWGRGQYWWCWLNTAMNKIWLTEVTVTICTFVEILVIIFIREWLCLQYCRQSSLKIFYWQRALVKTNEAKLWVQVPPPL